ncbi:unnamed protein product [Polarella glacialis]|uniref:Uncharacterized protein n=1 Tax=Polarella glacialis TaxID=89957 RepID=A0A813DRZ6_POLGL|nr:unnamed protein product [Polarella glacialis]
MSKRSSRCALKLRDAVELPRGKGSNLLLLLSSLGSTLCCGPWPEIRVRAPLLASGGGQTWSRLSVRKLPDRRGGSQRPSLSSKAFRPKSSASTSLPGPVFSCPLIGQHERWLGRLHVCGRRARRLGRSRGLQCGGRRSCGGCAGGCDHGGLGGLLSDRLRDNPQHVIEDDGSSVGFENRRQGPCLLSGQSLDRSPRGCLWASSGSRCRYSLGVESRLCGGGSSRVRHEGGPCFLDFGCYDVVAAFGAGGSRPGLWPWRHSVLTAAEKFAGDGAATEPAPRRALNFGAAEAAGPGLQQITDGGSRRSALKASSKASAKKPPSLPPPSLGGAGGPAMREAEQGGLSQADLEDLAKILQGGQATKSKLQARPMTEKQLEEEAQDEAEVLEERAAPTMAAALVKLTEVLAAMQGRSSRSSLEETLDGASLSSLGGFGGGGGDGLSGGKKNLRPLLHKALREQPEYFSNYMEKALRDSVRDFVAPSTSTRETALGGRIPARTYLQTKARIAGHRPTQFWSWQVAGALEALTDGKPEECKARLLLLLACGEQLCLDGGSMLLAQELVVEEIPPYGSFRPQEGAGSLAQPWSALLNPTWASMHLQHLQETESWMEKRKKLAGGAKPKAGASEDGATGGSGGAKAKARPRRAAKEDVKKEEK